MGNGRPVMTCSAASGQPRFQSSLPFFIPAGGLGAARGGNTMPTSPVLSERILSPVANCGGENEAQTDALTSEKALASRIEMRGRSSDGVLDGRSARMSHQIQRRCYVSVPGRNTFWCGNSLDWWQICLDLTSLYCKWIRDYRPRRRSLVKPTSPPHQKPPLALENTVMQSLHHVQTFSFPPPPTPPSPP